MGTLCFFDIDIGDKAAHTVEVAAHELAQEYFSAIAPQYGWGGAVADLDPEARELLQEAFVSDPAWSARGQLQLDAPQPLRAGRVVVQLCGKEAPKAADNFRCLATGERGAGKASGKPLHYKGVRFHRIVKGFCCQGGDVVKGDGSGGDSIYGGKFKDEPAALKLKHDAAGVVAMANSGKNSNTSQFFFTLAATPQCDGKHVVVGRVIEGLEVLQLIDERAASADGEPREEVVVADCGVLPART